MSDGDLQALCESTNHMLCLSSRRSTWSHWWSSSSVSSPSTLCQHQLSPLTLPPPLPLPTTAKDTMMTLWPLWMTPTARKWLWGSPLRRSSTGMEGREMAGGEMRGGRRRGLWGHHRGWERVIMMLLVLDTALKCEQQHNSLSICCIYSIFLIWH